jgi:DNA polymerase
VRPRRRRCSASLQGVEAARRYRRIDAGPVVTATVHPSSILRAPDDEARREEMRRFVQDLKKIAREIP